MKEVVKKVQITNELGLHTRPATAIVKLLQNVKSDVSFHYNGEVANAKSVLSLLMLAAQKHAVITIKVRGKDARETMDRLLAIFQSQFGESSVL